MVPSSAAMCRAVMKISKGSSDCNFSVNLKNYMLLLTEIVLLISCFICFIIRTAYLNWVTPLFVRDKFVC